MFRARRLRRLLAPWLLLLGAATIAMASTPNQPTAVFRGGSNGHAFEVKVWLAPFNAKRHVVVIGYRRPEKYGNAEPTLVDGRKAWGAGDDSPEVQIRLIEARVDGRLLRFP